MGEVCPQVSDWKQFKKQYKQAQSAATGLVGRQKNNDFSKRLLNIFKTLIMKKLKIKLRFFSLLVILTVSVFLTSCEQDLISANEQFSTDIVEGRYLLPKGLELEANELEVFLENATKSDLDNMAESANIAHYLIEIGKFREVYNSIDDNQLYTDIDLSLYLNNKELKEFAAFSYRESIESRYWVQCYWSNCTSTISSFQYGRCCYVEFPLCYVTARGC